MTPEQQAAMRQALEALEVCEQHGYIPITLTRESITALRQALEQQPADEPVAIHCKAKRENKGVCPHHNLQCGWPNCNETPAVADAVISTGQLSKMFQDLKGIDTSQSGYHWRVGWNAALRQALEQADTVTLTQTNVGIGERAMEAYKAAKQRGWSGVSDERLMKMPDELPFARSLSDELMDCVDRLGSEYDSVDPRVWDHLLVYAPKQPADEPVAWMWKNGILTTDPDRADGTWAPLYTRPQPAAWVGLTDEELVDMVGNAADTSGGWFRYHSFARAIEAKLREKNT